MQHDENNFQGFFNYCISFHYYFIPSNMVFVFLEEFIQNVFGIMIRLQSYPIDKHYFFEKLVLRIWKDS